MRSSRFIVAALLCVALAPISAPAATRPSAVIVGAHVKAATIGNNSSIAAACSATALESVESTRIVWCYLWGPLERPDGEEEAFGRFGPTKSGRFASVSFVRSVPKGSYLVCWRVEITQDGTTYKYPAHAGGPMDFNNDECGVKLYL